MCRLRPAHHDLAGLPAMLLFTAILGACATRPVDETDAQPAAPALSDANIASIVAIANTSEVREGQIALQRTSTPAVREFAQRMITDHTAVNQRLDAVLADIGIAAVPVPMTRQLESTTSQTQGSLRNRSGADFDRAYIDYQISYHQWLVESIDSMLLPSASRSEIEDYLEYVRPIFVSHLEHARQVGASLGR